MNATPIEELLVRKKACEDWAKHNAAFDLARAQGADFHCATMAGFAATDTPRTQERAEKETTMKCWTHCGRTLDELDNYCPACGEKRPPEISQCPHYWANPTDPDMRCVLLEGHDGDHAFRSGVFLGHTTAGVEKRPRDNSPIDVDALVDEWTKTPFPPGSKTWVEEQNAGLRQLAAMAAERAQCATIDELNRLRACEVALLRLREIYATSKGSDGCGTVGGDLCAEWNALLGGGAAKSAQPAPAQDGGRATSNGFRNGRRVCELCQGGGPCLYDEKRHAYLCRACHSDPADIFFGEAERVEPAAAKACHATPDGDCWHKDCPQIRDDEPAKTGRNCPLASEHAAQAVRLPARCQSVSRQGLTCQQVEGHEGEHHTLRETGIVFEDDEPLMALETWADGTERTARPVKP